MRNHIFIHACGSRYKCGEVMHSSCLALKRRFPIKQMHHKEGVRAHAATEKGASKKGTVEACVYKHEEDNDYFSF